MDFIKPKIALIGVGKNNKFGHPNLYTLYLLDNSKILRTDIDNSIKIQANKKHYKVYTFDSEKHKFIKLNNNS